MSTLVPFYFMQIFRLQRDLMSHTTVPQPLRGGTGNTVCTVYKTLFKCCKSMETFMT